MNFITREYSLFKHLLYNNDDEGLSEKWEKEIDKILTDKNYQQCAISLVKDEFGTTMLNGLVTPTLMLLNSECIEPKILNELLNNILCGYTDDAKTKKIMYVEDFGNTSYLELILMHPEIKLKRDFQDIILSEVLAKCENDYDYDFVSLFLMSGAIDIKAKKQVIERATDENLWILREKWVNEISEELYYEENLGDFELSCSYPKTKRKSDFEAVLKLIDKRIGE